MKYIEYLKYLIKHRWYVMLECFRHGLIWQGLVHDLSKFRPSEMIPYVNYYFGGDERQKERFKNKMDFSDPKYNIAWVVHQHRNPHHWQYWILRSKIGQITLEMPYKYMMEMYCDWLGAAKAQCNDLNKWYVENKDKIDLHPRTRKEIEIQLKIK